MLFVQVILGGSAVFGYIDVQYHLVWGVVTFGVLVTYLISFADSAEKASTSLHPQPPTGSPGTMRALSRREHIPDSFTGYPA